MLMDAIWLGGPKDGESVLCTLSPRDEEWFTVLDGEEEVRCLFLANEKGRWAIWAAERAEILAPCTDMIYHDAREYAEEYSVAMLEKKVLGLHPQTIAHTWTEEKLPDGPNYWELRTEGWRSTI